MSQARSIDDLDLRPKLIMGVEGEPNSGKSALALSSAMSRPPLTYLRFDYASYGAFRAVKKAGLSAVINLHDYDIDVTVDKSEQAFQAKELARKAKGKPQREVDALQKEADILLSGVRSEAQKVYDDFMKDYVEGLERGGTVAIDTFTEVYQMVRLSIFGLLRQVPQMAYERSNKEMLHLINLAEASDANLILLNKVRDEWGKDGEGKNQRTGRMITDGWDGLDYPAHVMVRVFREGTRTDPNHSGKPLEAPGGFQMLFTKCNDKESDDLTGTVHEIPEPLLGFDQIGQLVYGDDWNS